MKLDSKQRDRIERATDDWIRRQPPEIEGRWQDHVNLDHLPRAVIDILEEMPGDL
jgi:hypothetical protein